MHPLKLERLKNGHTQYHLGFLAEVKQVKISYAERGCPVLSGEEKLRLSEVFGQAVEVLFPQSLEKKPSFITSKTPPSTIKKNENRKWGY